MGKTKPIAHNEEHPVLSDTSQRVLRLAKWTPERRVDVAPYRAAFAAEGLTLPPAVEKFLEQFGSLVIKYEVRSGQTDVLEFCADDAVKNVGRVAIALLEKELLARHLSPIGHYQYGTCMLLQDELGRVFGVTDDATIIVGASGEEAVEKILSGATITLLPFATR